MNLTLTVKQLGKKQPLLKENILNLNTTDSIITVRSLIELVVEHQIKLFNAASFEWDDEDQIHLPDRSDMDIKYLETVSAVL